MKKSLFTVILIISTFISFSQDCNAVFFSQSGERFQVVLNGILQNLDYETNVKITDLHSEGNYKVTILFENRQLPDLNKTIYLMERNSEYTYSIKQNKNGMYVLRAMGVVPLGQVGAARPAQSVIVYSTKPPVAVVSSTTTVSTTSTTTNVGHGNPGNNVSMGVGMNIGGADINMNMNVNDGISGGATTTTTYSSSTTSTIVHGNEVLANDHYLMPGYNGPIGCPYPMSDTDFNAAKNSIASKSFSDSRLTLAKQITNSNCLTSEQAKQIILLFDFEDARLEYAKHAYGYTYDLGNYYKVNDAFQFELTIEELNNFIEGY